MNKITKYQISGMLWILLQVWDSKQKNSGVPWTVGAIARQLTIECSESPKENQMVDLYNVYLIMLTNWGFWAFYVKNILKTCQKP